MVLEFDKEKDTSFFYPSMSEAAESMFVAVLFSAFGARCASVFSEDQNKRLTATKLKETVKVIKGRAEKSIKFRFLFKSLIKLLEDIEKSTAESMIDLLHTLAEDMFNRDHTWYISFVHNHLRARNVSKNEFETALAAISLFYQHGAGAEHYILKGGWRDPKNTHDAGLTLLKYFAIDSCTSSCDNEINVTEYSGMERAMFSNLEQPFIRYVSFSTTKSDSLFKDQLMYDISLNCCNEHIEYSWDGRKMERAVWTLQFGRKYVTKELYKQLESINGQRKLDLT